MLMFNITNKNGYPLGRIQMHANGSSKLHTRDLFIRFLNLSWDRMHKSASTSSSTPTGGTSYFSFRHNCKGNSNSRACASTLVCEGNDVTCITCCQTTMWFFFSWYQMQLFCCNEKTVAWVQPCAFN